MDRNLTDDTKDHSMVSLYQYLIRLEVGPEPENEPGI